MKSYSRFLVLLLTGVFLGTSGLSLADPPERMPWWIVTFENNENIPPHAVEKLSNSIAGQYGAKPKIIFKHAVKGFVISLPEHAADRLRNNRNIARVERDVPLELASYGSLQDPAPWGLDRISQRDLPLNYAYAYDYTGYNVPIYVVDTGVKLGHAQFESRAARVFNIKREISSEDYESPPCTGPRPRPCGEDPYYKCPGNGMDHGTSVAAVAAGKTYGSAKKARIKDVKVFNDDEAGCVSWLIAGLDEIVSIESQKTRTAIVNMSLSVSSEHADADSLKMAVSQLPGHVLPIASAGNNSSNASTIVPANMARTLTVGATDINDYRASFSNYGAKVDIFAPGVSIVTTESEPVDGTSYSAPFVAGVAAMHVHASNRYQSGADLKSAILSNATVGKIPNPSGSHNRLLYNWYSSAEPYRQPRYPDCPWMDDQGNWHECQ